MVSFGGLFFLDGKDSKGRPVAVINASKLPEESDMRSTALQHILACLEPHADETGEKLGFSLVVYYTGPAPPGILRWLASVYHSLSYGVRKGVKTIALVNPSWFMSTVVTTLMPLVSAKAYKKVVMCKGLHNLGNAAGIRRRPWEYPSCTPSVRCDASESKCAGEDVVTTNTRRARSFVIASSLAPIRRASLAFASLLSFLTSFRLRR